jgi:hypothetical protein
MRRNPSSSFRFAEAPLSPRRSVVAIVATFVAAITTTRLGQASDVEISAPIVIVFEDSASDLPRAEIRDAVARELERPVRADPAPQAATLFIRRDGEGNLVVRYRPPLDELGEQLSLANANEPKARQIALVAKRLVIGASDPDRPRVASSEGDPAAGARPSPPPSARLWPRNHRCTSGYPAPSASEMRPMSIELRPE